VTAETFSVRHLADGSFGHGHDRARTVLVIVKGYFDASGSEADPASPLLTAAGFVATEEHWVQFEGEWTAELGRFGVESLHMKDYAHSRRDFTDWDKDEMRRREFLDALIRVAERHTLAGFSTSLRKDDYERANREVQLREYVGGPYALCCAMVIAKARTSQAVRGLKPQQFLAFVEHGDAKQHELVTLLGHRDIERDSYQLSSASAGEAKTEGSTTCVRSSWRTSSPMKPDLPFQENSAVTGSIGGQHCNSSDACAWSMASCPPST